MRIGAARVKEQSAPFKAYADALTTPPATPREIPANMAGLASIRDDDEKTPKGPVYLDEPQLTREADAVRFSGKFGRVVERCQERWTEFVLSVWQPHDNAVFMCLTAPELGTSFIAPITQSWPTLADMIVREPDTDIEAMTDLVIYAPEPIAINGVRWGRTGADDLGIILKTRSEALAEQVSSANSGSDGIELHAELDSLQSRIRHAENTDAPAEYTEDLRSREAGLIARLTAYYRKHYAEELERLNAQLLAAKNPASERLTRSSIESVKQEIASLDRGTLPKSPEPMKARALDSWKSIERAMERSTLNAQRA